MVQQKQTKRQRDIKTKLMAAVCMLLVSSIMMVSTTYAWFTLSTAPEVTGITTAVGANGNLEMALVPSTGDLATITSSAGDSIKAINERNLTWGNLVDLSDSTYYGLNDITLYPSELIVAEGGKDEAGNPVTLPSAGSAILATPSYGADGRVAELLKNTSTGIYDTKEGSFYPDTVGTTTYGVRAVGTASGMTPRQLSYRNARAAANDARGLAATYAAQSLNSNGNALASIAVKKAADSNATYSAEDLTAMGKIIDDLQKANGILDQIENAYIQYILAYAASGATGTTDTVWETVKAEAEKEGATLASVLNAINGILPAGTELPAAITDGIDAYNASVTTVAAAKTEYDNLAATAAPYTWAQISAVLTKLADPDQMEINGIPAGEVMDRSQDLIDDVLAGNGITVTVVTGGGVYADIADQCGDYSAQVKIENVEFSGMTLNTNATMNTKSDKAPAYYLVALGTAVDGAGAPESGATGENPMTDMYGYIVDLAFRTNAADSNLLLQVDAVDRIYESNETGAEIKSEVGGVEVTESTMGHGSSMTFASTSTTFSNDQVKKLMESIRIIFFDPTTNSVLATAKLDVANATIGTDGVTAKMYLYELASSSTTYTEDENGAYKLVDGEYVLIAEDETYDGTRFTATQTNGEVKLTDMTITALTQNTAKAVSVLVYLDGTSITNADVAATGSSSMKGTMNLQFASSAQLDPMDYTPLMTNQGSTDATEEPTEDPANGG